MKVRVYTEYRAAAMVGVAIPTGITQAVAVGTAMTAARLTTLAIPFLNVFMASWLVFDIADPAYRKIVPSVLNIALLRMADSTNE